MPSAIITLNFVKRNRVACFGVSLLLVLCGMSSFATPSASANVLPDPANLGVNTTANGHNTNDVYIVVANAGPGVLLDAPTAIVSFYFDTPNPTVRIFDGRGDCGSVNAGTGPDSPVPGGNTYFGIFDNVGGDNKYFQSSVNLTCGSSVSVGITGLNPYTIPGTSVTKYYARMQVTITGSGNVNAFRIGTNDGTISYSDSSGEKFALEDRDWQTAFGGNPNTYTTRFDLPFAPSCTYATTGTRYLRWFDDDVGTSYQGNLSMRLIEFDGNGNQTSNISYPGPWSGESASRSWGVTIRPGHKYIWRWSGVAERNGIQFQLPFDSFYYDFTCQEVTLDVSSGCDRIRFRVSGQSSIQYDARLRWDGADTTSLQQNLNHGNSPGQNVYEFSLANYRDFGTHTVSLRVRSHLGEVVEDDPVATIGPCATASCVGGPSVVGGGSPTPGDTVRIRQRINTNMGTSGSATLYSAQLTAAGASNITAIGAGPPGTAGTWTADASQAIVSGIGYPTNPWGGPNEEITWDVVWPTAGNYDTSVTITGPLTLTCSSTGNGAISVTLKPYLRVWGGDVQVGCSGSTVWETTSSDPSRGKILAFSRSNGTANLGSGSGSTLLVQALLGIEGFSSSQRSSGGMPWDKYLTLANSGSGVDPTWGGDYGGSQCATDFYAAAAASPGTFAGMPTASGSYTYSGPVSLPGATIQAGRDITIYVDGDVTITGNISYAGADTGWGSLSDIPEFKLIARGDIKVSRTVSELSGTYIAQPRDATNGGTIYTCTNGTTVLSAPATLISQCSSQLTVYGGFIAKSVKFLRLSGSLSSSVSHTDTAAASTAAEKFVYGPEAWLKSPATSVSAGTYDSITSLPPAF